MKKIFLPFLLLFSVVFTSLAQVNNDSADYPNRILILDTIKIPLENSKDYFIAVEWVEKMEIIKDEKYRTLFGNKDGVIYIYIKKKYIKKVKRELGIK